MSTVTLSGLASGFDWNSFIDQMIAAERIPEQTLTAKQTTINDQNSAFTSIKSRLTALQTSVTALKNASLYDSRTSGVSDSTMASSSVSAGAAVGTYAFNVTQMATASKISGTANVAGALSSTSDVSSVTLATAGFPATITAGTFTVNGKQVTIATTDTLQQVFGKIADATDDDITASYDPGSDKISLTSASESAIVLGSATDTSNFLQATRLYNNGTDTTTSTISLGSIRSTATLASANFATAISDGGSGAGEFKINGVSISFNASTDTVNDVVNRINNSTAGVTASYDSVNDRFIMTSDSTGDMGIALEDVTGNFLAASRLSAGVLSRGNNLLYTINGGDELVSQSNTITADSSSINGLSLTALKEGSVTVTVDSDTSTVKTAIQSFITAYNSVQSFIDTQTTSSTSSNGKVTAGLLARDSSAKDLSSSLRQNVFQSISGLTSTIDQLADLGIQTNGYSNTLALSDSTTLDDALKTKLNDVKEFFSDSTRGLAVQMDNLLTKTIDENDGTLIAHQATLTKSASDIDDQIAVMEKRIAAHKEQMTSSFTAMEEAQAKINQQLTYLLKQFSS